MIILSYTVLFSQSVSELPIPEENGVLRDGMQSHVQEMQGQTALVLQDLGQFNANEFCAPALQWI